MKLKRKLISLSLLVSALTSFCAFGSVAKAAPKVSSAVASNNGASLNKNGSNAEEDAVEAVLADAKQQYYNQGLDRCENNKIFGAYVEKGNSLKDNLIHFIFSQSFLKSRYGIDLRREKLNLRIVDSEGRAFSLTRKLSPTRFCVKTDAVLFYGLGLDEDYYKDGAGGEGNNRVDEGFSFAPGKEYSFEIYDSKERLVVKEHVVPEDYDLEDGYSKSLHDLNKKIAHLSKFDEDYYRNGYFRDGLKNMLVFDGVESAVASNKSVDVATNSRAVSGVDVKNKTKAKRKFANAKAASVTTGKQNNYEDYEAICSRYANYKKRFVDIKNSYYQKGLNKCEHKPDLFVAAGVCEGGEESNDLTIFFSPTLAKLRCPNFENLNRLHFKIYDSKKRSYSFDFLNKFMGVLATSDLCRVYVPSVFDVKSGRRFMESECFKVDKGFRVDVGEKYFVKVCDSKGNVIVEGSCVAGDESKISKNQWGAVAKKVAHSFKFNSDYYEKLVKKDAELFKANKKNKGR